MIAYKLSKIEQSRYFFLCDCGGGERARTDGLLLAKQALSQLSYTPKNLNSKFETRNPKKRQKIVSYFEIRYSNLPALAGIWWAWMELNHRPHAYQACALTGLSYRPQ